MQDKELQELVAREVDLLGFECVKCEVVGSSRHPVLRLYIDKPGGVNIDDCARVSRAVGLVLDAEDPFTGRYLLEVSSPGSNRALTRPEHFERFAGHEVGVKTRDKTTYTGRIGSCINGVLTLDTDDGEVKVALSEIVDAQLLRQEYKIDKKMKKDRRARKRKGGSR